MSILSEIKIRVATLIVMLTLLSAASQAQMVMTGSVLNDNGINRPHSASAANSHSTWDQHPMPRQRWQRRRDARTASIRDRLAGHNIHYAESAFEIKCSIVGIVFAIFS
jgi:hypothetical protein